MSVLTDDLDALLADTMFSVPVSYGAVTTRGWMRREEVFVSDGVGQVLTSQHVLTLRTGVLTVVDDTAITIDGASYRIRSHQVMSDGLLTKVVLA